MLSCHVQSSKSALEQYMGRWPMVMIHGRAARFLLAFWREGPRMRGGGGGGEAGQGIIGDLHPGYLEVALQPVELSLYQVAAVTEEEVDLRGEGDDVGRA